MEKHISIGETIRNVLVEETANPESLSEMEEKVRRMLMCLGNVVLHLWFKWLVSGYPEAEIACRCSGKAQYVRQREARTYTMFGWVKYQRAYYLCSACQSCSYPTDEQLGLRPNAMSAEVERLAGITGVQMPFGKGSEVFEELTLVSLSA